jgi:phosphate transport system substrate-binding protein
MRKHTIIISIIILASLILGACSSSAAGNSPQNGQPVSGIADTGAVSLNGAGGTFPLPVYTAWIYAYQKVDPSVTLNYQGIGSGGGKKGIIDGTLDFAGSDSLLSDQEYASGKDLQMYPTLAGAVVPIFNIQGYSGGLVLSREALAGIYSGKIIKWNDPAIASLNSGAQLPAANITVVHRSDGSGTTEIFTKALSSFSSDWKTNVGSGTSVEWPADKAGTGVGGKGNQGVAAAVQNTPNSIGYVELSYAVSNKIPFAQMVNKAGKAVTANADSLASAMNDFANSFTDKLTTTIVDGSGQNTWPIAGYTYIILHDTMKDCAKQQNIVKFLSWALTDPSAAKTASDLGYSVLPPSVRDQVIARLGQVKCQ